MVGAFGTLVSLAFCIGAFDSRAGALWGSPLLTRVLAVILVGPAAALPPVGSFLLRDWLLRRRVRYVLRTRGSCHACHYSLIGLPVSATNFVVCPECGMESEVDQSLGELVVDQSGQARYQPSAASLPKPARVFTAARRKKIRRVAIVAAFVLGIGLPAVWGGYEFWLRHQADQAIAERPGPEGFMALVEKSQPPGVGIDDPDAWDAFHKAQRVLGATDNRVWRGAMFPAPGGAPVPNSTAVYPDPTLIYYHPKSDDAGRQAQDDAARELALKCMEAYRAAGVFDALAEMAACRRAAREVSFSLGQPAVGVLLPELGQVRNLARINAGRMMLAAEAKDLKEFAAATEVNLALARMCHQQAFLLDALVGNAVESMTYARLREVMAGHPDAAWLDAVDGVIARQGSGVPRAQFFEGERLSALDTTAWMFQEPSRVRKNQISPTLAKTMGGTSKGRLGTYVGNRDEFNARFDALSAFVAKDPWERGTLGAAVEGETKLMLVNLLMPSVRHAVGALDQLELDRRGYRVMAALERYRLEHGAYPGGLAELSPEFLKEMPLDPWSGKALGYVRLSAPDELGREYLLYTVGVDGVDNGGATKGPGRYDVLTGDVASHTGMDFIINDPQR